MSGNPGNYNPYITVDVAGAGEQVMLGDGSVRFVRTSINAARSNVFAVWLTTGVAGISPTGIGQLLRAEIVTGTGDRRAVANAILRKLGFANTLESKMLMPAVQRFREASGVSAVGALQVLSADPVSSPRDRTVLAGKECLVFFLGGSPN